MTWQVEQAQDPPQAPAKRRKCQQLEENYNIVKMHSEKTQTFHLKIVGLGNIQQVITLGDLKIVLLAILVNKRDIDPDKRLSMRNISL